MFIVGPIIPTTVEDNVQDNHFSNLQGGGGKDVGNMLNMIEKE